MREDERAARAAAARQRLYDCRKARRSRWIATAILLVAVLVIAIVGLEARSSELGGGTGRSTPFSLLPVATSGPTSTTESATTTTTGSTTTTTSTTTLTTPVASVQPR